MIAHKQKKIKKKRVGTSGQLPTDVTASDMGLRPVSSSSISDPDCFKELLNDTRKFSQMLLYLKEAILSDCFKEVIHIRLEELLCILKSVMNKHQNINFVGLQNAAEVLIAKVKAVNLTEVNEENKNDLFREVSSSIETLALTFGNTLTNILMGDIINNSSLQPPVSQDKTCENISVDSGDSSNEKGNFSPIELDNVFLKNTDSVELALSYAKTWSKYTKNIVSWVEKKLNLELESTRNILKLAETTRANIGQAFMPLQSVFSSALLDDIESSHLLQQTIATLQANKFVQPLLGRKNEMEKQRKEIKELWKQEKSKMLETETALKKAKLLCMQRQDEYEKAKSSMFRAEEEHICSSSGSGKNLNKQLEKKRRLEEEALQKVEEANELYKVCVTNVDERRNDLENTKREILTQLRTLVFQCDLTLKAVTVNLFQMQHLQVASLANSLQSLYDIAKLYDPGQGYNEFVKATNSAEEEKVDGNVNKQLTSAYRPADSLEDVVRLSDSCSKIEEDRCSNSADTPGPSFVRSWTFGMFSDSESTGGSSESRSLDSESISPGDFHRKLPRTPSSGTMSSADDLDEREPPSPSEAGPNSLGMFKKTLMSKAAVTHKFRKLRSPTKCRDCEGIVVFQGVECEECFLVCHRKCLENLMIICGHQKLPGKMHIFGAEFIQVARKETDGIPFILKMCVSEVENKALSLQGIYRVCGSKLKIEKLCQALENGMHLVDMSEFSTHDICDVLKLYLRQLPEPFILFRLYKEFIDLTKEIQHVNEEQEIKKDSAEDRKYPNMCIEINRILLKSKDLLRQLPASNFNSLQYLIVHLKRVVDHAEENKMNAKNLGVIFGPNLIRPRSTTAPVTISSLAEYSNQAHLIEFLITYSQKIFDGSLQPQDVTCSTGGGVPLVDQGSLLKPLLAPEEKDSEHCMKSLFFSSKEDIHNESNILQPTRSSEESEHKQNALGKCDACLFDNKVHLLLDPELESASQKIEDVCKTSKPLTVKPDRVSNNMWRYIPRTKARPVSLPLDKLLLASPPSERNGKNMGNVNSDKFCKTPTFEELNRRDISPTVCSKFNGVDQQTLQKTWAKQCEQTLTVKTTVIMPNTLQEKGVPGRISGDDSSNAAQLSKPYTEPLRSAREASEKRSSDSYALAPVRGPRTLQPQHWTTFYKPHTPTSGVKGSEEKLVYSTAAVPPSSAHTAQGQLTKSLPDSYDISACPAQLSSQPKENSKEHDFPDVTPMCQRPKLKRMQQFEDLEDEIPQFV